MHLNAASLPDSVLPTSNAIRTALVTHTDAVDSSARISHCSWTTRPCAGVSGPLRTLIVDDYSTGAEALCAALNAEGHIARYALGGVEAVDMVSTWTPDVIILDINMPEFDGYETAKILRKLENTRQTGIIAFTALSAFNVIGKAQAVGIDAYCQKGTAIDRLLELIDKLAEQAA